MNVFDLDQALITDYERFARSFTLIRAPDIKQQVEELYASDRFWPEPLISIIAADALAQHNKLLAWMADSLKGGPYLAGDAFSIAECAVIPYILRLELLKLRALWDRYPAIADWWARMRARPSVKATIFDRMSEADWGPSRISHPIRGQRCRHC